MADKDLKREPHHKGGEPGWWWYEEPKGVSVCIETGAGVETRIIPWRSIRAALRRKDAK